MLRRRTRFHRILTGLALAVTGALATEVAVSASEVTDLPPGATQATPEPVDDEFPNVVPPDSHDAVMGSGWAQTDDQVVVGAGTRDGFAVLRAHSSTGYQWETVASLALPGVETDSWVGNVCVTGTGDYAVAVFAPRAASGDEVGMLQGGHAAILDLTSGTVTGLGGGFSLAYFNPGCGLDDTVALTSYHPDGRTRVITVKAATGALSDPVTVETPVTSITPTQEGLVGAVAGKLVTIEDGDTHPFASVLRR